MTELEQQVEAARRQIVSDGYDMSIGELVSLYRSGDLVINPNYQRLYRWSESQKTRFIESLMLGIPVPPIFVYQKADGVWELIDGLQRTSTVLEFVGELIDPDGHTLPQLKLEGTNLLPALANAYWSNTDDPDGVVITPAQQREMKRARIRFEILKKESDEDAKFELFQRLNTGGSPLSEQEVRNCVLVMVCPDAYDWLISLSESPEFAGTVSLSENAKQKQRHLEIVLRFIAYRKMPYKRGLDVNEYLDKAALKIAHMDPAEREQESRLFGQCFTLLHASLGADAFRKWDGNRHAGQFSISGYDAIVFGLAESIDQVQALPDSESWLRDRIRSMWSQEQFERNSGMGVRGTTRLVNLLPFGKEYFRP